MLAALLPLLACSSPMPATPVLGAARSPRAARIVEPRAAPGAFPRTVRDSNGEVLIPRRPQRIHTLSVGFDEITYRVDGRWIMLPYAVVQPGSAITLGERGPLIMPKELARDLGIYGESD